MAGTEHTFGERLRWAIEHQPAQGRQRGLRLFQRRIEAHAGDVQGTSLSALQSYLRGDAEPSLRFVEAAARLLAVRPAWLAWGIGAPTEEEERGRAGVADADLRLVSEETYRALGVATERDDGGPRFWGPAVWAPVVRQTALRLYQYRPAWQLIADPNADVDREPADERFRQAVRDTAAAIAAPLRAIGVDGSRLTLTDIADYVQAIALALQRSMFRYAPGSDDRRDDGSDVPVIRHLLLGDTPEPQQEDPDDGNA